MTTDIPPPPPEPYRGSPIADAFYCAFAFFAVATIIGCIAKVPLDAVLSGLLLTLLSLGVGASIEMTQNPKPDHENRR